MAKDVGKTIYTVGNITKDVYLRLDARARKTYADERNVPWLSLPFDGSVQYYRGRKSVLGGSAVSTDVFKRFGLNPLVAGARLKFKNEYDLSAESELGAVYRYILVSGDQPAVFAPSDSELTFWEMPIEPPGVIYLDRACQLNLRQRGDIVKYLKEHQRVGLALWANSGTLKLPDYTDSLGGVEMVFVDVRDLGLPASEESAIKTVKKFHKLGTETVVVVDGGDIYASNKKQLLKVSWALDEHEQRNLFTGLTTDSLIGASFLGGYVLNRPLHECLLLAKYGVENADLEAARTIGWLSGRIAGKQHEVKIWQDTPQTNPDQTE
ncbi:MAG: hypothetical protein LBG75_01680 [Candidatus Nomurabacteria bacterium]|jgi:hypothetical protein|nr:hypothetical protein [Candidatus Nomurabacteria bacterium]